MPLTFILSQGRTATFFISNVISFLPKMTSCHERNGLRLRMIYHGYYRKLRAETLLDKITKLSWGYLNIDNYAQNLICKGLHKYNKSSQYHIEVNNMIKYYAKSIFIQFPEANFIHIIRDPRTHVQSGINRSYDRKINRFNVSFLNRFLKLYFPFWSPRPTKYLLGRSEIDRLFEITVINWLECNKSYMELSKKTNKYYRIKFEDFIDNPLEIIQQILKISGYNDWQNIDLIKKAMILSQKNKSQNRFNHWKKWEDKYIFYLNNKCGELMNKFGYGQEKEWLDRLALL